MTALRTIQTAPAKANELFAKIADTTPGAVKTRETLFAELKTELELITQIERDHLLPVLRKNAGTKDIAPKIADRLTQMKASLASLDAATKEGTDFPGQVAALKKLFQAHLRDEKNELLPAIQKALSDEQLEAVATKVEADKTAAETAEREAADARRVEARRVREAEEARAAAVEAAEKAQKKAAADASRIAKVAAKAAEERAEEAAAALRAGVETAAKVQKQASAQMAEAAHSATAISDRAFAAARVAPILAEGFQNASREWMGWAQGRMQRQVSGLGELLACRSPSDLVQIQTRLVREGVDALTETSGRLSQIAAATADKAARTVSA